MIGVNPSLTRSTSDGLNDLTIGPLRVTCISMDDAVSRILAADGQVGARLVVTPNIVQVAEATHCGLLMEANRSSYLALPDGWPVAMVAGWLLQRQVDRVSGADLVPALCVAAESQSVIFVGGKGNSAEVAGRMMKELNPRLRVLAPEPVPPAEFADASRRASLVSRVAKSGASIVFIGLGVPKQEQLALEVVQAGFSGAVLCIGAALEYASGNSTRSPKILRDMRLEWAWRLACEPRKMGFRYLRSAPVFFKYMVIARVHCWRQNLRGRRES